MSKKVFYLVLAVITVTFFTACEREEIQMPESPLAGKWVVTSGYHASDTDTIVFTKDFFVLQYFDYLLSYAIPQNLRLLPPPPPFVSYSLSGDNVKFSLHLETEIISETYEYVLDGNSLIIKGFSNPFSFGGIGTGVHFTRIE